MWRKRVQEEKKNESGILRKEDLNAACKDKSTTKNF
jgi:hypothetical protein